MSRRATNEAGVMDARQRIWDVLRAADAPMTRTEIMTAAGVAASTVAHYLTALGAAGLAQKVEGDSGPLWSLMGDQPCAAPRLRADGSKVTSGSATRCIWTAMRQLHEFSALDLAALGSTDTTEVTENLAKVYCSKLLAAGYLRVTQKAVPGHRKARYRLIRNTGPKPPVIQRVPQVFDPNTRTAVLLGGNP